MGCLFRAAATALLSLALTGAYAQNGQDTVGGVADVQGRAEADREAPDPVLLAVRDDVFRADLLRTREDSLLTVSLADGSWFSMDAETEARMEEYLAGQGALLTLAKGRHRVFVSDAFSRYDNAFRVQTDDAVRAARACLKDELVENERPCASSDFWDTTGFRQGVTIYFRRCGE